MFSNLYEKGKEKYRRVFCFLRIILFMKSFLVESVVGIGVKYNKF